MYWHPAPKQILSTWAISLEKLSVIVGSEQLRIWSAEDQVGIYATLDLSSFGSLAISVEKDFACLDGSDENNRDTFVNPLGSRVC